MTFELGGAVSTASKFSGLFFRERRNLKFGSIIVPIVNPTLAGWEQLLDIKWDESKINSIFLHRIYIRNNGNREVRDITITVSLAPNAFVFFPSVTPENCLSVEVAKEGTWNVFRGTIDFINPKDRVEIVLNEVNGAGSKAVVTVRAAGAACIEEEWKVPVDLPTRIGWWISRICLYIGVAVVFIVIAMIVYRLAKHIPDVYRIMKKYISNLT